MKNWYMKILMERLRKTGEIEEPQPRLEQKPSH
jgi:hypothetical protein